ncbi:MAG TPA: V-type ATP synthase subunit D [Phycisphaerae bacterium]|nr:V-type ATP synthase subunit D [Phycisphaerae bacterium]HPS53538.1 V-type ATP synthase subunit D [Phycisphaerae bacterium]
MAAKIKLTRPELKRQRDALRRFQRYLPMLKLKQQQLQMMVRRMAGEVQAAFDAINAARRKFAPIKPVLVENAGVKFDTLAKPSQVNTSLQNVAGVNIPVFSDVEFPAVSYSLFATPAWVDETLRVMREISRRQAEYDVRSRALQLIERELTKIVQRVNLFEKVKIPEAKEAIRRIRIKLGDEMTAAVGRSKIAKAKISVSEETIYDMPVGHVHNEGGDDE